MEDTLCSGTIASEGCWSPLHEAASPQKILEAVGCGEKGHISYLDSFLLTVSVATRSGAMGYRGRIERAKVALFCVAT